MSTVEKDLVDVKTDKKRIVIVDADDRTIQANEYEAYIIGQDVEYPTAWQDWVATASGKAIPGAVEFLNYAASKGVETYYFTNRNIDSEYQGTLDNYKKLGFPFSDTEHVMYRQKGMSDDKQPRQLMFGTTLMGADRTRSVVDADSRSHDHLNLFIVGSSVFPTASTADPMLTLAALALRTAEKIKNELAAA